MKPSALVDRFEAAGQGHVFAYWDRLDTAGRDQLSVQLERIDLALVSRLRDRFVFGGGPARDEPVRLEPPEVVQPDPACRQRGEALLGEGRVACLMVAGGQGTRLGFDGPKGAYPIGPISRKSLFELFAEQLMAVQRRYGRPVTWLVMTSRANQAQTRAFFERHDWFGFATHQIRLFEQGMLPALDREGRLVLDAPNHLFESPNGHGGTLEALRDHGLLPLLREQGIELISYAQVDNPLATLLDPVFIGHHVAAAAEMSTKVVRKHDPREKVGLLATIDGRPGLVEYSDMSAADQAATAGDGLRFWAGNIAMHCFSLSFLERIGAGLPYHLALKAVPLLGPDGAQVGTQPGHKFERFIFDALPLARRTLNLEVQRAREFGPVKNAEGADSPAETHRLLLGLWNRWLERAGLTVPPQTVIEISPLYAMDAVELARKIPSDLVIDGPLLLE